ncbi:MAG: rRNA maturation RNase YbeY [Bacteroidetes bacterium]|nr:MAG: rRNA maturation RNase YbeY [Bacteroidota bacterium]
MIDFEKIDVEVPGFKPELFVLGLTSLVNEEHKDIGAITVVFCSDEYLLEMNRRHLDHDYFTDIITFDYCEGDLVSGDLFISVDRVSENSKNERVEFLNELARVCVHGVLHLCGYGDKSEIDQVVMRQKEDYYLRLF